MFWYYHSMSLLANNLVIAGGIKFDSQLSSSVFAINMSTYDWVKLNADKQELFSARCKHASSVVRGRVSIHHLTHFLTIMLISKVYCVAGWGD